MTPSHPSQRHTTVSNAQISLVIVNMGNLIARLSSTATSALNGHSAIYYIVLIETILDGGSQEIGYERITMALPRIIVISLVSLSMGNVYIGLTTIIISLS